ncbi:MULTISPECIES: YpdA family putative bacillithiol disulfide reductase [Bacillaceae]|uniref:YpdA family putative bacillithiol disulfide reductase n=1 Tax=Bacillaceae TaxID=186817 RepID=UPI001E38F6A8|nr:MULTISPECIES: YpdA family putative bacillithiol disulfide reductase [Bacillaceae]MCE4047194.1 YpdA family putative bacillithiol disulfide reductase [Bacillus sp. Au-Bac7]MCM3031340.1 YpdA family putative bacillithiol disulfide reductase [Niallia sp. MER 6]MDL0435731.1 YpdA family putative bacillithiol disulfide reductase [Niallia sp. SS-2023]UPO86438.1 YpdA family putative bacillithiol disulfide reductase [Niallia sp. Man26]
MNEEQAIIIGAGPCGLAAAIALQKININPLIIEKGNVVNAIHGYPTHQTFFSTSEKLEIGDVAFLTEQYKPNRNQALVYYREVAKRKNLRIHAYEEVQNVTKENNLFKLQTSKGEYRANYVIVATGYYDHPNYMNVPGEDLPKVSHYFKEAHPYFNHDVTVIGGKNSSVDAAIELVKAGARVTVLYRGTEYSSSIKPWILPEFEALVRNGVIKMEFASEVVEIKEKTLTYKKQGENKEIANDFVFAMTGYHPDHGFIKKMGVEIEADSGRPVFNPDTMETNVEGIFIAGVIAAGNNANEIFIENGRFHGDQIAEAIAARK